jgi:hypothetical protein
MGLIQINYIISDHQLVHSIPSTVPLYLFPITTLQKSRSTRPYLHKRPSVRHRSSYLEMSTEDYDGSCVGSKASRPLTVTRRVWKLYRCRPRV